MSAGHEVKKRHLRWLSVNSSYSHSSLALPRIVAAMLEDFQTPEGIRIPEVLVPYTGFDIIK